MAELKSEKAQIDHDRGPKPGAERAGGVGVRALDHLLQRGGVPDIHAVAAIVNAHPSDRGPIVARLHQTLGNQYVGQVFALLSPGPVATTLDHPAPQQDNPINGHAAKLVDASKSDPAKLISPSAPASLELELRGVQNSLDATTTNRQALLPAHRAAVNALERGAVLEIAARAISIFKRRSTLRAPRLRRSRADFPRHRSRPTTPRPMTRQNSSKLDGRCSSGSIRP